MKAFAKGAADEPKKSEKAANPRSTSELKDVSFPDKTDAKKVVPIAHGDEGSTGRQLNRKLQTMFVFIVILGALQVVAIVAVIIWMRTPATPHEQARAELHTAPVAPSATQEKQAQEAAQEAAARDELKERIEELKESSAQEAQTVEKLKQERAEIQRRINDKKRKLKELNDELAVAEGELSGVRSQIAQANFTLRELRESIARANSTRRKSLVPVAQTTRRKAAVAQLEHKVRGLKGVATQKERRVKDLKMQIAGMKNADDEGKNRRTRRKTRNAIAD